MQNSFWDLKLPWLHSKMMCTTQQWVLNSKVLVEVTVNTLTPMEKFWNLGKNLHHYKVMCRTHYPDLQLKSEGEGLLYSTWFCFQTVNPSLLKALSNSKALIFTTVKTHTQPNYKVLNSVVTEWGFCTVNYSPVAKAISILAIKSHS